MTTTMVDNILSTYDHATDREISEGRFWYVAANALCWELDHIKPINAAGVIAALSPRLHWNKNVAYARLAYDLKGYDIDVIVNDIPGGNYLPTLNGSARKAMKMVNGTHPLDILGKGLKTNAFFDNILHPYTSQRVTVDKHAFDIAMGETIAYHATVIPVRMYRIIENAYRDAAHIAGIRPLEMQAITWHTHRAMKKGK